MKHILKSISSKTLIFANDLISIFSLYGGYSEYRGHHFYSKSLNERSIVLDIGANLGDFSKLISENFKSQCVAVEPVTSLYDSIPENESIRKFNYALSDSCGSISIHLSENPEANSIFEPLAGYWENIGTSIVEAITFDVLLEKAKINKKHICLVKVDIEGAEIKMFESISDELLKTFPQYTIEFHDFFGGLDIKSDIEKIKRRFQLLGYERIEFSKPYNNSDVLFFNRSILRLTKQELISTFLLKHVALGFKSLRENCLKIFNKNI
ncbi:MAG: FkbM family methyltransferase [Pseudanabaena sp. ELA607]|jgi:FkbM family methyltransferase